MEGATAVDISAFDPLAATAAAAAEPAPPEGPRSYPDEDRPAVILFTSGSTGLPKGAVLSHRALIAGQHTALHLTRRLPHQIADDHLPEVTLQSGPVFHIGGLLTLLRSWLLGGTAYAILRYSPINLTAVIIGLFVLIGAVFVEVVFEIVYARK